MTALKMEELEALEAKLNLTSDGLTYQQRCSRIAKVSKGKSWSASVSEKPDVKRGTIVTARNIDPREALKSHPLYGKRVLITPLMVADKNRNVYFEEPVGHDIEVEEVSAGAMLYGTAEDVDRMVGDYKVIRENPNKIITAKTTLPKVGQEISWLIGTEIVPVVRGNDGQRGYVWSMPTHLRQYGDTMIQVMGLKTFIVQFMPELLPKFSGRPVMMYVDGLVPAASIPQTEALLKEYRRKELQDARLGLV